MSEPFSRARWKNSSGDFFFGIGGGEKSDSRGVQKRIAKQKGRMIANERMRGYRSSVSDQEQTECRETIGNIIRAR